MSRPVILGNGALTIGLNRHGLVHDFYYPYVGLENLTTSRSLHHSIGVWVDGHFTWVDDGSWQTTVNFEDTALISSVTMINTDLNIELYTKDFVDTGKNIFCRQLYIKNTAIETRDIRLFMHQVFQISNDGRADTALYEPEEHYIYDYKGRCALLIGGRSSDGSLFDQFAVGNYGVEGKEGTYKDAEDGELSGSLVEHGGVDSVIRFQKLVPGNEELQVDYWIVAAESQQAAEKIHVSLKKTGLNTHADKTREYWHDWMAESAQNRSAIPDYLQPWVTKSLLIIKAHIDKRGGIIASCDSSIYNYGRDYYSYVWPRDGAFVIWPLIKLGYKDEAKRFFTFCRDIMHPDGYMMHKYQPDKAIASTWHPLVHGRHKELAIQEDETAVVLFMLGEYYTVTNDVAFLTEMYESFIKPAADFMSGFIDSKTGLPHASYDLWEEKFLTHTYTTASVYGALTVAVQFAELLKHSKDNAPWRETLQSLKQNASTFYNEESKDLVKGFLYDSGKELQFNKTLDVSSAYGPSVFNYPLPENQLENCVTAIEQKLLNSAPIGGVPRYEYDNYFATDPQYMGNPWFVTTLWLAQYYCRVDRYDAARDLLHWSINLAGPSGLLAEQVHPENGRATGVSPLVWSHAELINTILAVSA